MQLIGLILVLGLALATNFNWWIVTPVIILLSMLFGYRDFKKWQTN